MKHKNCFCKNIFSMFIALILMLALGFIKMANAQYLEAPTIFENGIRKSTQITVHFKEKIFELPQGIRIAHVDDMTSSWPKAKEYFAGLEKRYGAISFVKQIPNAAWGDVWRRNRRTEEMVKIHDMSQLFFVKFASVVPIDSIVVALGHLSEVEYAHAPIEAISLLDPNDPQYLNGIQWDLTKINASKAWDITQGSSSVIVGIVECASATELGLPDKNHIDFYTGPGATGASKFVTGLGDVGSAGGHATGVAGIVGAATNDGDGVASLGWNIKMIPYYFVGYETGPENLVSKINRAVADSCDVINCSFITRSLTGQNVGDCIVFASTNYPSVETAVANAIAQGIVVVAGTGNTGIELTNGASGCQTILPTIIPYTPYPASYQNVIGVSATDVNDVWAGGRAYNYETDDDFIDVAAPGIDVKVVDLGNSYDIDSGTSFSGPHVSALAGLILSINSQLQPSQVKDIIRNSTIDLGTVGEDHYFGTGRIDAYQALLLTHAYSTKSTSSSATAFNGGRRVIKDGSNKYHAMFESGVTSNGNVLAEIFYRNHNGVSWSPPVRLSVGNEQNRYPSIAGNGANLYAAWQRKNGSTHDVYFHKSTNGGAAWTSTNRQVRATSVGASDPLPVIASPASNELMLVYRSGNNLAWQRSTGNGDGGTWSAAAPINGTALNSPSLCAAKAPWNATVAALAYATNVIPNASNIIARYFNSPSWSQEHNMSSGLPGNLTQHARPSIAPGGDGTTNLVHIAWDAYDSQYAARVIIHKAMSTWNVPSSYYEFHNIDEDQPSITGLAGSKAAMVFRRGANNFFIGSYSGSSWSIQFPAVVGKYPSFSLGGTQAKHLITSGSAAPYQVTLSSSTYSKVNALTAADKSEGYHRAVGVIDTTTDAWLNVRVENFLIKHKDGSSSFVDFASAPADTLALSSEESWAALASDGFVLPVDAESLLVEVSVAGEKVLRLGNASNPLTLEFKAEASKGQP